jgi:hypothetical protein
MKKPKMGGKPLAPARIRAGACSPANVIESAMHAKMPTTMAAIPATVRIGFPDIGPEASLSTIALIITRLLKRDS